MRSSFSTIVLNNRGERPVQQPRAGLHPKIMLSLWRRIDGIVYYELLDSNQSITAMLYCDQVHRLKAPLSRKRPSLVNRKGVILHHDNARPHTALMI